MRLNEFLDKTMNENGISFRHVPLPSKFKIGEESYILTSEDKKALAPKIQKVIIDYIRKQKKVN